MTASPKRIYYADGSVFDGSADLLSVSPREGVLCLVGYTGLRRYNLNGWDFYRWDEPSQQFWGADIFGVIRWARADGLVTALRPGAPTYFDTPAATYDLIGLIEWLKSEQLFWQGETVTREAFEAVLFRVKREMPMRLGDDA